MPDGFGAGCFGLILIGFAIPALLMVWHFV